MENFTLQSGRIYKFEVWGAKGGNGGSGGAGGNGSHAVGWYDMRTSANVNAQIFAGGVGSTSGAGWGATSISSSLTGTPGGSGGSGFGSWEGFVNASGGGGGGGASGIYIGATAILVAGGGGGGGGANNGFLTGGAGGGQTGANSSIPGYGATQSTHGSGGGAGGGGGGGFRNGDNYASASGGGGGAGGGYARGFAGGGGGFHSIGGGQNSRNYTGGGGGGGSGGTSYIGGVQSLKDTAGKASITWGSTTATGNGKVVITEYLMSVNVASPTGTDEYLVSAPSKTSALFGESYTFTITREIGVGDVGLLLNTTNGSLSLTSTNGNVFTYTVSNVQGPITASDFSVTTYNVEAPPDGEEGYTISNQSATSVLKGGSYTFIINLQNGYAMPRVSFSGNGKLSYSGVDQLGNMTVTISNVQGAITAGNFTVTVFKVI